MKIVLMPDASISFSNANIFRARVIEVLLDNNSSILWRASAGTEETEGHPVIEVIDSSASPASALKEEAAVVTQLRALKWEEAVDNNTHTASSLSISDDHVEIPGFVEADDTIYLAVTQAFLVRLYQAYEYKETEQQTLDDFSDEDASEDHQQRHDNSHASHHRGYTFEPESSSVVVAQINALSCESDFDSCRTACDQLPLTETCIEHAAVVPKEELTKKASTVTKMQDSRSSSSSSEHRGGVVAKVFGSWSLFGGAGAAQNGSLPSKTNGKSAASDKGPIKKYGTRDDDDDL